MTIEVGLFTWLCAQTAINSVVGTRIYPVHAPEKPTIPYIVYQVMDPVRQLTQAGISGSVQAGIEFTCYGGDWASSRGLAVALRGLLNGFSGLWGTVPIGYCEAAETREEYIFELDEQGSVVDAKVGYLEA